VKTLVADDSRPSIRLIKNLLIQLNVKDIEVAKHGKEVLNLLEKMRPLPDVILLDIIMPVMDGIKTLKIIRSNPVYNGIKIILVSSEGSEETILESRKYGADDFIVKPIKPGALESKLKQMFPKELFTPSIITRYISEEKQFIRLRMPKHLSSINIDQFEFEFSSFIKQKAALFDLNSNQLRC